jgi:hypothetical protein
MAPLDKRLGPFHDGTPEARADEGQAGAAGRMRGSPL